ncbi:Threonine/homoserine efflux transporter RhtA [Lysobacter spongiicola DSM 21749]|uniref:Threonine/homoserine efflux transporter RhtA n=2 Tax=Novilysobacter TaxID=3382699 RepID=A0A1T4SB69_9GAMM|nr:Threonine/homoserine efflux transporter RhtA [Lysobacter spongiicola DSM 21749]
MRPAEALAADMPAAEAAPRAAWLTPLELVLLAAVWGISFMFQRVAAPEFGTAPLSELRLAFGAIVLLPFLWRQRRAFPPGIWPKVVMVGAINSAVPFALFAWAAQNAPAGISAITNAMAVLFTALVGFMFFGERIGIRRAGALLVGFAGVVVLASGKTAGASLGWAVAAGCAAAFLYGVGVHLLRRYFAGLPQAALAAATLGTSALLMLPFAIVQWPTTPVSMEAWLSAGLLGVVCTGLAYAIYYRLVQRIGASRAVTVTYLVPLFAVGWAWWLLDEPLTLSMGVAGLLILGSVAISQNAAKK